MTKLENAQLCDEILLLFKGHITIPWNDLRAKYGSENQEYFIRENKIKYLLAEGLLGETLDSARGYLLFLTPKGFATMADLENLGYVSKEMERLAGIQKDNRRFVINLVLLIVSIAVAIVGIWLTIKKPQS